MPPGKKKAAYECLANYHCLKWQVAEISRQNIILCFMCILLSTVYQLVYFLGNRSDTGLCGEPSQAEKAELSWLFASSTVPKRSTVFDPMAECVALPQKNRRS